MPRPSCGGAAGRARAEELLRAAELGADVPFCLVGGRARVTGIGEVVDPLPFVPLELTLMLPPFGCSTPAVYRAWDELGGPRADGPNDLEPAALAVEPRLAESAATGSAMPPGSCPAWPAADRPGSSKAPSRDPTASSCGRSRRPADPLGQLIGSVRRSRRSGGPTRRCPAPRAGPRAGCRPERTPRD